MATASATLWKCGRALRTVQRTPALASAAVHLFLDEWPDTIRQQKAAHDRSAPLGYNVAAR